MSRVNLEYTIGREEGTAAEHRYRKTRVLHWNGIARWMDRRHGLGHYYHRRLMAIYRTLIPPGQRVIEIGCAFGDLLAAVKPSYGVGIDFSDAMIARARARHPHLKFVWADINEFKSHEKFDYVILSDIVNDLWDVQSTFEQIRRLSHPRTRVIINTYSRLWELPLSVAQKTGLAAPTLFQNWLTVNDIVNLLRLADLEVIRNWQEVLLPVELPLLSRLCNHGLVKIWPFNLLALSNFMIARPQIEYKRKRSEHLVSVIIPARNEAGNIKQIWDKLPDMGKGTELVFVEGHSEDDTYKVIAHLCATDHRRKCKLLKQSGKGKGDAVRQGFGQAQGDILMIYDADLTVPPADLARFYDVLCSGKGEFVNGVRLVYPMEEKAMRLVNLMGNKFFSVAFTWLLGQNIKDTLCGTKALWREDYRLIAANRAHFGDFDPFGDFDLLFGAARLNLKIMEVPIRYRARSYGVTNISRWTHGGLLLRMVFFAANKIKFI